MTLSISVPQAPTIQLHTVRRLRTAWLVQEACTVRVKLIQHLQGTVQLAGTVLEVLIGRTPPHTEGNVNLDITALKVTRCPEEMSIEHTDEIFRCYNIWICTDIF